MASGTLVRKVMLRISADDGDTETKIDRIAARADELAAKHPELKVRIDTAAAQAKMGVLRQELKDVGRTVEAKIKPVVDQAAAAAALAETTAITTAAGAEAGAEGGAESASSFGSGFSAQGGLIAAGVTAALAALPAIAAGAGAAGGIALGGALLIGTKKVKGPLYDQFHGMLDTLRSVLRIGALPLVKPLGDAFAQIGQWAKALYPEIRAVFASLGPLVAPLAKGLEGIVSGILPGFITLMKAAAPAMSAVTGLLGSLSTGLGQFLAELAPGIRASSQVLAAFGQIVRALLPFIASLANSLAAALRSFAQILRTLAPVTSLLMRELTQLAGSALTAVLSSVGRLLPPLATLVTTLLTGLEPILPQISRSIQVAASMFTGQLLRSLLAVLPQTDRLVTVLLRLFQQVISPNLPVITQLATNIYQIESVGMAPVMVALPPLMGALTKLTVGVLQPMIPVLSDIASWLATIANAANAALSLLSRLPGMGGLGAASYTPAGVASIVGGSLIPPGLAGGGGASASSYATAAAAAAAAYGDNFANGVTSAATGKARQAATQAAADIPLILSQGVAQGLAGSASQVRSAISKLLSAVSTDVHGKYITEREGTAISKWLEADQNRLVTLADRRQAILNRIHAADKYAANVTSSTESTFGLISAATSITPALGVGGIMRQLLGDVAQIRVFRNNIAKLRRMGLNKAYIDQLIQAGPVQGGQVAAELAAGNEGDIHAVNQAESAIARASRSLGRTAAEAMYDSGKNAGKGFLSGLESQESQLKKLMKRLADTLVDTLRHELKIHSPSQRVYDLLRNVPAAAVLAIDDGIGGVSAAARRMSRAMLPGPGSAGYAAGSRTVRIELEWVGGNADQALITLLKHHIRVRGGDPGVLGA